MSQEIFMPNEYGRKLSQAEIDAKVHRDFVGGLWDEIGVLQFEFLKAQGLRPDNSLLDIGCGALRGGVHFIRYLTPGHYFGIDINSSLVEAGWHELQEAELSNKRPKILINDEFKFDLLQDSFDYLIAQSVFTHLPMNQIIRCLAEARRVMHKSSVLFATYFQAPTSACLKAINHPVGGITSNYDKDPFHYSIEEFAWMADLAKLKLRDIGDWGHPRAQKMLGFSIAN